MPATTPRLDTATVLLTAGVLGLTYLLGDVLLLVFAAILLAVGLDGLASGIAARGPVRRGWALAGTVGAILAMVLGALGTAAAMLVQQLRDVAGSLALAVDWAQARLRDIGLTEMLNTDMEDGLAERVADMAGQALTLGISAVGAVSSAIIVLVLTLFLAINPGLYRRGLVRVVPPARRAMTEDTLSAIAHGLRWWFLGQLVSMAVLGTSVGLGLFVLGIEVWLALALLTALLTFVPFIGALAASVPIVAVGFAEGTQVGLIVLAGYVALQNIEGNLLMPMIQHRAVNLAPALLVSVQVLLGVVFGVAGLVLAAPLTVVAMIAVQKMWVEHTLGERVG